MPEVTGGLVQNLRIVSGKHGGDVSLGHALIQQPPCVKKSRARAGDPGACRHLAIMAFATNLNQLADRGDTVVIALPKTVA